MTVKVSQLSKRPTVKLSELLSDAGETALGFMTDYSRSLIGQGAMFGFGDEAEAGVRSALGSGTYDENLENIRGDIADFSKRHPYIATGTEVVGAAIPAVASGGTSAAASIPAMAGRAAAVGAGSGALYGAGTGEGAEDRAGRALTGGAVGGGVGAVGAPVAAGLVAGGRALAQPLVNRARAIANPQGEAARSVATAIDVDQRLGQGGLTPQGMAMGQQTGQPVMNMDRGGEVTRRLARSAANQSPEAGAVLQNTIDDRFVSQGERLQAWLRSRTGVSGDASGTRETLQAQARRANRPAYQRAYTEGDRGLWSPTMERLASSPDVVAAMKSAVTTGKSRAVNEGFGGFNPGVRVSEDGRILLRRGQQGTPAYPNLQYWDYVKRELDDAANAARRAGRNEEAARVGQQAQMLRDELDRMVPSYQSARQGAASFFQAQDALEAGQNFLKLNADLGEARRALARFSAPERRLFEEGFVSTLMDRVNRANDRTNVIRRVWGSPKARQQIQMVLGPRRAQEFEAFMAVEEVMDAARGAMGNSTTARQLMEMGLAAGQGVPAGLAAGYSTGDPVTGVMAALMWRGGRHLARRGMQNVDESVARRIATMLTSNDPAVYQQGVRAVARSNAMMRNLRSSIAAMAGVTGGQGAVRSNAGTE